MKAWEVIGYTYDAAAYCLDCAADIPFPRREEMYAIFAIDEWYDGCTCDECGEVIVEAYIEVYGDD